MTRWGDKSQPRWFTLKSFTLGLLTLQSNTPARLTKRSTALTPALRLEVDREVGGPRLGVKSTSA
jgi:hypothetical protein